MLEICGPPPCTTTTRMPRFWSVATSPQKRSNSSGEVMALPPYFTTTVRPRRRVEADATTAAASARDCGGSAKRGDTRGTRTTRRWRCDRENPVAEGRRYGEAHATAARNAGALMVMVLDLFGGIQTTKDILLRIADHLSEGRK